MRSLSIWMRRVALLAGMLFAACLFMAYRQEDMLPMAGLIAVHILLIVSAGIFKVAVVVEMACRHERQA